MQRITHKVIRGQSVEIDSKHFVDCTLIDCILEYSGGEVIFEKTHLKGCRHVFYGRARQILGYLRDVGAVPASSCEWDEVSELVH